MFTVALIGADGAGKTTIARRLTEEQPLPMKYLYMGVSKHSSDVLLPTTRAWWALQRALGRERYQGGPPDPRRQQPRPAGRIRRAAGQLKRGLRLGNQLAEEWYRQALASFYRRQGFIVLYDRHYFADYYAHDVAGDRRNGSWARRLHGRLLERFYPRPDLIILLDAPADVLYARKQEGSLSLLEQRRREYWRFGDEHTNFVTIDATRPLLEVMQEVLLCIQEYGRSRNLLLATRPGELP